MRDPRRPFGKDNLWTLDPRHLPRPTYRRPHHPPTPLLLATTTTIQPSPPFPTITTMQPSPPLLAASTLHPSPALLATTTQKSSPHSKPAHSIEHSFTSLVSHENPEWSSHPALISANSTTCVAHHPITNIANMPDYHPVHKLRKAFRIFQPRANDFRRNVLPLPRSVVAPNVSHPPLYKSAVPPWKGSNQRLSQLQAKYSKESSFIPPEYLADPQKFRPLPLLTCQPVLNSRKINATLPPETHLSHPVSLPSAHHLEKSFLGKFHPDLNSSGTTNEFLEGLMSSSVSTSANDISWRQNHDKLCLNKNNQEETGVTREISARNLQPTDSNACNPYSNFICSCLRSGSCIGPLNNVTPYPESVMSPQLHSDGAAELAMHSHTNLFCFGHSARAGQFSSIDTYSVMDTINPENISPISCFKRLAHHQELLLDPSETSNLRTSLASSASSDGYPSSSYFSVLSEKNNTRKSETLDYVTLSNNQPLLCLPSDNTTSTLQSSQTFSTDSNTIIQDSHPWRTPQTVPSSVMLNSNCIRFKKSLVRCVAEGPFSLSSVLRPSQDLLTENIVRFKRTAAKYDYNGTLLLNANVTGETCVVGQEEKQLRPVNPSTASSKEMQNAPQNKNELSLNKETDACLQSTPHSTTNRHQYSQLNLTATDGGPGSNIQQQCKLKFGIDDILEGGFKSRTEPRDK